MMRSNNPTFMYGDIELHRNFAFSQRNEGSPLGLLIQWLDSYSDRKYG